MNRKLLKLPFRQNKIPEWTCPTCNKGVLRLQKNTFQKQEIRRSREARSYDEWEPEWIEYIYNCLLLCSNEECKENVLSCGTGFVYLDFFEDDYGDSDCTYTDLFLPKYFEPHLRFINIPSNCPSKVSLLLCDSFKVLFLNPKAALNSVRSAIEELLSELNIKRFSKNTSGKQRLLTLHERIDLIPAKYEEVKDMILAIKWLGNAGSHGHKEVSLDDVMHAYELTEHILEFIFVQKVQNLENIAKKINKKKGPV